MRLTEKEKAVFTRIDEPIIIAGKRLTRPVVLSWYGGKVIGIDSVTSWRRFIKNSVDRNEYTFELRNMWP